MKTNEIREKYLDFFQRQGHTVCPSDVLVPKWDNTVLFTPAGMNPFKDHFLGKVELEFTRATSCQKCLRTGDIENVGRTAYHHTFFEMLGNFSFGDYFKKEAIAWAWEFLTDPKWMGIDPQRLTVTVYQDDDEAADIWQHQIGLPLNRIGRLGEHDNFWPAGAPSDGPDGVCGPCSEIFYHPDQGPECEIWNLVFTQFNRHGDPPDNLTPLPSQNIDTGMGLERMAAMMQGVETNFHIDSLLPLVQAAAAACHQNYEAQSDNGRRLRRIADHVRACTMAIHENVIPGTQKENYVIRRLLRRAVLQGHEMGMRDPFLFQIVPVVAEVMSQPYPELQTTCETVARVVRTEEEAFLQTLDSGLSHMERIFARMQETSSKVVDGQQAFDLFQEQGIPAELLESIATERGLGFDWQAYQQAREHHAVASGAGQANVMGDFGPLDEIKKEIKSTEFLGYECTRDQGVVCGLVSDGTRLQSIDDAGTGQLLVLDRTPFYAEAGGQVGDSGLIVGPHGKFSVDDVRKDGDVFVHQGRLLEGTIRQGDRVAVQVDEPRREGIQRAHSATHILHFALQKYLGEHAQQRGSKVEDDHLRFDFANQEAVSPTDLQHIEEESMKRVAENAPVKAQILPMQDARQQGAMMLFGEKYPDPVRMVSIGEFSKELCGGTHVSNTSQIAAIEIVSEEAVSTGVRRIVALTGEKARQHAEQTIASLEQAAALLGVGGPEIPAAVKQLIQHTKALKKQLAGGQPAEPPPSLTSRPQELSYAQQRQLLKQVARDLNVPTSDVVERIRSLQEEILKLGQQIERMVDTSDITPQSLRERAIQISEIQVIVSEVPGANADLLRKLIDQLRQHADNTAVFLAAIQGPDKVMLLAGLSKDLVKRGLSAGDWVKSVAPTVGGGGGGRPDMAQAGGKQPEKINVALDAAREYLRTATVT